MAILRHPPYKNCFPSISGFFHMLHFTTFATFCCKKKLQCFYNILMLSKYLMVFNNFDVKKVLMISNFLTFFLFTFKTQLKFSCFSSQKRRYFALYRLKAHFLPKNKVNPLVVRTVIWAVISPYIGWKHIFWKHTWNFFWFF